MVDGIVLVSIGRVRDICNVVVMIVNSSSSIGSVRSLLRIDALELPDVIRKKIKTYQFTRFVSIFKGQMAGGEDSAVVNVIFLTNRAIGPVVAWRTLARSVDRARAIITVIRTH